MKLFMDRLKQLILKGVKGYKQYKRLDKVIRYRFLDEISVSLENPALFAEGFHFLRFLFSYILSVGFIIFTE